LIKISNLFSPLDDLLPVEDNNVTTVSALSPELAPIPDNGEEVFPIDKTKHTSCEYEGAAFTIKKRRPSAVTFEYIFDVDHDAGRNLMGFC
jgi:hypothetical protein